MTTTNSSLYAVITTIQPPTPDVRALQRALKPLKASLLIVGDRKGPIEYPLAGAELWTLARQQRQPLILPRLLTVNHYGRKNIGYLVAISRGATCIYETDDDNRPLAGWRARGPVARARRISRPGWFNVFTCFTDELIWPRGFPLSEIGARSKRRSGRRPTLRDFDSPIQQGLVNLHPDVDAIWRLAIGKPLYFRKGDSVALMPGVWCPFNSQATWWFPAAYPLMYLPSHCTFRMTDIWRSFVAQRCLWAMGGVLTFHQAEVVQRRNRHDLMQDFAEELPGHLGNEAICRTLEGLDLEQGPAAVSGNLRRCYEALVAGGIFPKVELALVRAWLRDLKSLSRGLVL